MVLKSFRSPAMVPTRSDPDHRIELDGSGPRLTIAQPQSDDSSPRARPLTLSLSLTCSGKVGEQSPGEMLQDDDIDVVSGASGRGVFIERTSDLIENLGWIGTVMRLKHRPEPLFPEQGVRRIHRVG